MKKLTLSLTLLFSILLLGAGCYQTDSQPEIIPNESDELPVNMEGEATEEQSVYIDLEPADAKKLIDETSDLVIIDVSPHYAKGHLPGAVNYYLGDGSLDKAIPNLDKEKSHLVYCHVESVSRAGAQKLIDAGFTKVYRLNGDYSAWINAGYEIEK